MRTPRACRERAVTSPGAGGCISGAVLYDGTIRRRQRDGGPFLKAIIDAGRVSGIQVDTGASELAVHPDAQITEDLDGLCSRLAEYARVGARFARWRGGLAVAENLPSQGCTKASSQVLAQCSWTARMRWSGAPRSKRLQEKRIEHKQYSEKHGQDMPEIRDWSWSATHE